MILSYNITSQDMCEIHEIPWYIEVFGNLTFPGEFLEKNTSIIFYNLQSVKFPKIYMGHITYVTLDL